MFYGFLRLLPHQSPLLVGGSAGALPEGLEGVFRFLRDSDIKQEYTGLLLTHRRLRDILMMKGWLLGPYLRGASPMTLA